MSEDKEKAKQFCSEHGVCFVCFSHDPEILIYLEKGVCKNCSESVETEAAKPADESAFIKSHMVYLAERRRVCYGCQQALLNQQGHMQPGGCLYESESESDSE